MTGRATLCFHWQVLIDERTADVGMALKTDLVAGRTRAQLLWDDASVNVVAVAALDKTFLYAVMKRSGKLRFLFRMAPETELRLVFLQHATFDLRLMGRMTSSTSDIVGEVLRPEKIGVLHGTGVTRQADPAGLLISQLLETYDLRDVAAAFHMD
jgi:hypothetical protein